MSIVQVIVVCSSPKAKTLSKPEHVQTGIKVCPQDIPVWTGFTVYISLHIYIYTVLQSQNAVTAYLSSKQLLSFSFTPQCSGSNCSVVCYM